MSSNKWKAVLAVVALGCFGSKSEAQTTGTTGTTGTVGTDGAVRSTGNRGATTSLPATPEQQVASAEALVNRGTVLSQHVSQMLDEARREADVMRVTCLNDKLTQINANLRTAQGRLASLQRTTDADQRTHEMTVLTVLGQKLQVLDQEANQCVGQDLYETGPTRVETDIDTSTVPYESDPTNPNLQAPTVPPMLGVVDASASGISPD